MNSQSFLVAKNKERALLEKQIKEFLAKGNTIKQLPTTKVKK